MSTELLYILYCTSVENLSCPHRAFFAVVHTCNLPILFNVNLIHSRLSNQGSS